MMPVASVKHRKPEERKLMHNYTKCYINQTTQNTDLVQVRQYGNKIAEELIVLRENV